MKSSQCTADAETKRRENTARFARTQPTLAQVRKRSSNAREAFLEALRQLRSEGEPQTVDSITTL
jgi:hypothetical protein